MPNTHDESRVLLDRQIEIAKERLNDTDVTAMLCLFCKSESVFDVDPASFIQVSHCMFGNQVLIESMLLSAGMRNKAFARSVLKVGIELFERGATK